MLKRCIERQIEDGITKKAEFPLCTRTCAQGRKNLKALGGSEYIKTLICDEKGCNNKTRKVGKCGPCYERNRRIRLKENTKQLKEETMVLKECGLDDCTNKHFAEGLCEPCYQKRYREIKKPNTGKAVDLETLDNLKGKAGDDLTLGKAIAKETLHKKLDQIDSLGSLLNELEKEVNDLDAEQGTTGDRTPDPDGVRISFKNHPELKDYLQENATRDFRTLSMHTPVH